MAFITLSGTLLDPNGDLAVGDQIRFTHKSTTGETVQSAVSIITVNPAGTYSLPLQYGLVLVEYKDVRTQQFKNLGVATVNGTNPATSIPELLNALVPVSSAELIEFQAILADCVTAQNAAAASAAAALVSENAAAASAATIDLINDLSQAYIFETVALFKASLIEFPDGKTVYLNDRNANFIKITGTGTANKFDIIASTSVNQSITIAESKYIAASQLGLGSFSDSVNADGLKRAYEIVDSADGVKLDIDIDFTVDVNDSQLVIIDPAGSDYTLHIITNKVAPSVYGSGKITFKRTVSIRRVWALVFKDCKRALDKQNITWEFTPVAATVTTSSQHGTMHFNCIQSLTTGSNKEHMDGAPYSCTGQPIAPATSYNTGYGNKCIGNIFNYYEQCSTFGASTFEFEFSSNICKNHWLSGIKISTDPINLSGVPDTVGSYSIHHNQHSWDDDFEIPLQTGGVLKTFPHAVMFETVGRLAKYSDNIVNMKGISLAQSNDDISCVIVLGEPVDNSDKMLQDLEIANNTFMPTDHHTNGNLAKIQAKPDNLTWDNKSLGGWISIRASDTRTIERNNYSFNVRGKSPDTGVTTTNIFFDDIFCKSLSISGDFNEGQLVFGTDVKASKLKINEIVNFSSISMNSGTDEVITDKAVLQSCDGGSYFMRFDSSITKLAVLDSISRTDNNAYEFETNNANCDVLVNSACTGVTGETVSRALKLDAGRLRVSSDMLAANSNVAFELASLVFIRAGDYYGNGAPTVDAFPGVTYTDFSASGVDKHYIKTSFTGNSNWSKFTIV